MPKTTTQSNQYRTYITSDLSNELAGQNIRLAGWVHTLRAQSKIIFLVLRDRWGIVQAVILPDNTDVFFTAKKLSEESFVALEGTLAVAPQAPGGLEIQVQQLEVLSAAEPQLPIPIIEKGGNETDQSVRLDYRWLDLRKPKKLLIFKVWTLFETALREYFTQNDFLQIHSPKLMSAASESGAEVFEVKYFERAAYLAQSPQFYKQMAMAAGFERVFEIGPVFRAEPSFTTRHATEFTGFDFEMSLVKSHQDVINTWTEAIVYALQKIKEEYGPAIKQTYNVEVTVPTLPFPQLTMAEAKKLLADNNILGEHEGDLSPEEERALGDITRRQHNHEFIYITDYPIAVRPFYHMRAADNPGITLSFDLLWKGMEITTGAQREHRCNILSAQAKEKGLSPTSLQHYFNFFRYGCPPHGGAGIGLDRMIMLLLNINSIREATYLYRGVKRLTP